MSISACEAKDLHNAWYQRKELAVFKIAAKHFIFGVPNETNRETRGYERLNVTTAKKKALAIRFTLLAIKNGMQEEEVTRIANQCSAWSRDQALKLALKDYCETYHPEAFDYIYLASSKELNKNKRQIVYCSQERRVRTRTC